MEYKESKYNYSLENENKTYIYNLLTRSFIQLESKKWIHMKENGFRENLEKDNLILLKYGIIVPKNVDEYNIMYDTIHFQVNSGREISLFISMTSGCNFNCPYCYQDYRTDKKIKEYISINNIDNIVNYVKSEVERNVTKTLNIVYFGGEPTLCEDRLIYAIEEFESIKNVNKYHTLITNGYLISDNLIDTLRRTSEYMIQITVDGTEKNHNKNRPLKSGGESYKTVIKNLEKCCERIPGRIYLRENISEEEIDDYYSFFEILKTTIDISKLGGISLNAIFSGQKSSCEQSLLSEKIVELINYGIENGFPILYPWEYGPCLAKTKNGITVDEELKAYICPGSLYQNEIGEIKDGRLYVSNNSWYESINTLPDCVKKCKYAPICFGGCSLNKGCKKKDIELALPILIRQKIKRSLGGH